MRTAAILGVVAWCVTGTQAFAQDKTLSITLVGQSMIRSDIRATAPGAMPAIKTETIFTGTDIFVKLPSGKWQNMHAAIDQLKDRVRQTADSFTECQRLGSAVALLVRRAAQKRRDALEELENAERLGDVLIGVQPKAAHPVLLLSLGRENDHWHTAALASYRLQHVIAVDARQH